MVSPALLQSQDVSRNKAEASSPPSEMGPWLASDSLLQSSIDSDGSLLTSLKSKNEEELKRLDDKIADVEANHGETELSDALRAKASYIAKIGEKEKALQAYDYALSKQAGLGAKIDLRLSMIRVGFFAGDFKVVSENIDKTKE